MPEEFSQVKSDLVWLGKKGQVCELQWVSGVKGAQVRSKLVGKAIDSDFSRNTLRETHTLSLPAYFYPLGLILAITFSEVSLMPAPQPSLSILYSHNACSHLSGLTILDTNYPSPQLDYKLLEGRAVFVSFIFTYSQCLQCTRC